MRLDSVRSNNINFKGVGPIDVLSKTFDTIAKGGAAANFLTQDLLSCGVPRTISSLNRNKDVTGKNNYTAAAETAIRESLTGTSTFFVPAIVIAVVNRMTGKANKVPEDLIKGFTNIVKDHPKGHNLSKSDFFKSLLQKNVASGYINQGDASQLLDKIMQVESAPKRNFFKRMFSNKLASNGTMYKDQLLDDISDTFIKAKRSKISDLSKNLESFDVGSNQSTSIKKLYKQATDYFDDLTKQVQTKKGNFNLEKFKNSRATSRVLTNVAVFVACAVFLSIIPKLYTLSKTNPEAVVEENKKGEK